MIPSVIQVYPQNDLTVYVYFSDGCVKRYDVGPLVGKGVFKALENPAFFMERCTVLNGALAWDLKGGFDARGCIDIDPVTLYENGQDVEDPLREAASRSNL